MSLQCVPQHAFLHILAYIGRPHDFMQMLMVSKSWRSRFDESDVDLWYTISIEYDIAVNKPSFGRSLRSTTDHRRVFFQTYFKKQREMDERHELLIVQAKSILEGARDQPAKLAKLIEKCFPNPRYFNPDTPGKTMEDNTLLTLCCRYFQNKCIKMMVNRFSANVNVPDMGGFTPLILCAYHGNFAGVLFLLDRKVDLLAVGRLRSGPRLIAEHWAAIQGHMLIFRYLHALRRRSFLAAKRAERDQLASSVSVASLSSAQSTPKLPAAGNGGVTSSDAQGSVSATCIPSCHQDYYDNQQRDASAEHTITCADALSLPPISSATFGMLFTDEDLSPNPEDSNWSALTAPDASSSLFSDAHLDLSMMGGMKGELCQVDHSTNDTTIPVTSCSSASSSSSNISSSITDGIAAVPVITPPPPEEHFCLCRRGYEGQMVGCDSGACPVEWFHFECVGLLTRPTGRWLCALCTTSPSGHRHSCIGAKPAASGGKSVNSAEGAFEADEAADPFCICGHEGVGQMVSCDNAHCLVEWYHFPCVGLAAEPEGHWECPTCTESRFHQPPLPLENAICPEVVATQSSKRGRRTGVQPKSSSRRVAKRGQAHNVVSPVKGPRLSGVGVACTSEKSPSRIKRARSADLDV